MHAHRRPRHNGPAACFCQCCVQGAHLTAGTNACIGTGNDTRQPSRVKRTTKGKISLILPLTALGAHAAVRRGPPRSRSQPGLHVTHGARGPRVRRRKGRWAARRSRSARPRPAASGAPARPRRPPRAGSRAVPCARSRRAPPRRTPRTPTRAPPRVEARSRQFAHGPRRDAIGAACEERSARQWHP